jgi:ribonucleoside-diphosphate reductase alpha chain
MSYTKEEVVAASLEYHGGDALAAEVFLKYALHNPTGMYEELTPDDMHKRLAREFARMEQKFGGANAMSFAEIYGLLKDYKYIAAQGSPSSGIGNPHQIQSLSNCFVIEPPFDSYGGILHTDQEQVQIMKRRGGVGFDISPIRPKGMHTSNAAKTTDGIGPYLQRFSSSCREVAQGGRRGALMLSISCNHPEIETFINIKRNLGKVTGANMSIRITDEFMNAMLANEEYSQQWPVDCPVSEATVVKRVSAKKIWDMIIDSAWTMAEPGVLFWDTICRNTPADAYTSVGYGTAGTNPCSELNMSANDSCRLMILNLISFVKNPWCKDASFDFEKFHRYARKAQRLMDDLVELELEVIEKILAKIKSDKEPEYIKRVETELWRKIQKATKNGRRTGLGPTGLGDALAMLGLRYGSEKSIEMTESIYRALAVGSYTESVHLADERGAFPVYDPKLDHSHAFIAKVIAKCDAQTRELYLRVGRRNIANTTTAPVGSLSTQTKTTSGIENAFMLKYNRNKKIVDSDDMTVPDFIDDQGDKWKKFTVYHHGYSEWMKATGLSKVEDSPYFGATVADVDWKAGVDLQAAAQKWVCHSISKTCNLPNEATRELVAEVYTHAWQSGCKGFTVYRDGCRTGVLTSVDEVKKKDPADFPVVSAPKRPSKLDCDIHHATIKGEKWTLLVGMYQNRPYEVLGGLASDIEIPAKYKTGTIIKHARKTTNSVYDLSFGEKDAEVLVKNVVKVYNNPNHAAFTRTISLALRHGANVQYLCEQLVKDKDTDFSSFTKVISRILKKYITDGAAVSGSKTCEACHAEDSLVYQEGCMTCTNCGSGKCG